jgi:hypothetical protein
MKNRLYYLQIIFNRLNFYCAKLWLLISIKNIKGKGINYEIISYQ